MGDAGDEHKDAVIRLDGDHSIEIARSHVGNIVRLCKADGQYRWIDPERALLIVAGVAPIPSFAV